MREFGGGAFGEGFGAGRRGRRGGGPQRGSDMKVRLSISLEEAATGAERTLELNVLDPCDTCGGSGAAPGTSPRTCSTCEGAGEVRHVQRAMLGQFVTVRPCPDCRGEGETITTPCEDCRGEGRIRNEKSITIEIPAGISSDDALKLSGRGHVGSGGGPRGNILAVVEVESDDRFERRGDDLIHDLPLTFSQAALGAEVEVPTVYGTEILEVPAGIQSGQALRMRGHGMPKLRRSGKGDQIVRIRVWTPTDLSADQREALERLSETEETPPEPDAQGPGFWDRVKKAFTA